MPLSPAAMFLKGTSHLQGREIRFPARSWCGVMQFPYPFWTSTGDWNLYVALDKGPDSGARLSGFRCCRLILRSWMMFIKLLHLSAPSFPHLK